MKAFSLLALLLFSIGAFAAEPDSTKTKKKGNLGETIQNLPETLLAAPDKAPDSAMYFLKNDNFIMTVWPVWQEKGMQTNNDLKMTKVNEDPLDASFPLKEKKIVNDVIVTMANVKKPVEDKKQLVIGAVKTHLQAVLKEAGKTMSGDDFNKQANSMISGPEPFTTNQGKQGDLYLINDYQVQQSDFLVILLMPGPKPGTCIFIQFNYIRYTYDTAIPDDLTELKVFGYPDDQDTYADFSKKILKTLVIN